MRKKTERCCTGKKELLHLTLRTVTVDAQGCLASPCPAAHPAGTGLVGFAPPFPPAHRCFSGKCCQINPKMEMAPL